MLEFAILGPLEVRTDDRLVAIGGFRQKALLAVLLLNANEVVSSDRLLEELWGAEARADTATLRVRISQLRKALRPARGDELIQTRAPGYALRLERDQLDLGRFERLAEEADLARDDDPARAAAGFREALGLWRGPPLADFAYEPFAQTAIGRLEELRLTTLEKRIDAELALGRENELVGELNALVAEHPLRERFRGQLLLALYRAGRQAEALEVYRQTRRFFVDELGIEPGPALQELHRAVLAQDHALERQPLRTTVRAPTEAAAPKPPAGVRHESRKTVTVLFCDVVESTSLGERFDAEVMRRVMERYFQTSAEILRRHGGTVEKFIGDAVMAVFGIPTAHEDDALRAVRAAAELRRALVMLNDELEADWKVTLSTRLGLDTGEVVAGDAASGQAFVTGEAVNVAARLQQAADQDEVLLGEATWGLVRGAVGAEFASLLTLKGKGRGVAAWRLLDVDEHAPPIPRRLDTPFLGRIHELAQLRSAYERTCREQTPCLFTVFGEAGIGKSRLAEEARLDLLAEARVLVGRCLPYGEGITFAPLREIVHQTLGDTPAETLPVVLAEEPDGGRVADCVSGLLGLAPASVTLEEGAWGIRRLCEALAQPRPLVLVFEDVHWAEATLLDLIEYVAENARESAILLLCLARHELLDQRPGWGGGKLNATAVALESLPDEESELLAGWLIRDLGATAATRARVVEAAQGNPLFVEQLVAMLADGGWRGDELPLPATVEALLAARLELLGPAERATLEYAAVLGDRFDVRSLVRLVRSDLHETLPEHLRALVRKELLRPARLAGSGESYRFRHILVREAAYRRLPKEERADLHERYADWLESTPGGDLTGGREELLGYHLERAHAYRVQLGPEGARARALAERATEHLAAAAAEAFARTDWRAVDQLLARATALMARDDPRLPALLYDRGTAVFTLGRMADADAGLAEAIEAARVVGDERTEWRAAVDRFFVRTESDPTATSILQEARLARDALSALERLDDDRGLARAWLAAGWVAEMRGRAARMEKAAEQTIRHARRSGVYREEAWGLWWLAEAMLIGPTPVRLGMARCEELLRGAGELRVGDVGPLGTLALFRAMQGEFDAGRQLIAKGRELIESLGHGNPLLATMRWRGELELLANDPAAAEVALREGYDRAAASGNEGTGAEIAARLARAVLAQGRGEEAERLVQVARDCAPRDSRPAQALWRSALAMILVARGETDAAVELAGKAARLLRATDLLPRRADVFMVLASVLEARGQETEAARAAEQALALYAEKGNLVAARRAREHTRLLSGRALASSRGHSRPRA